MNRVYLDHIAATPLDPRVLESMLPYMKGIYGNPQSPHRNGQEVLEGIDRAREQVAGLINADPAEIFFTSSGTESNNFALKGLAFAQQGKGKHIVLSAVEHQSILHSAKRLEKFGFSVSDVPVDKYGMVDPDDVSKALTDNTVLVSIMLANGEVGTIQPAAEIAKLCREKGVIFHSDAVDAVGNIPVDVKDLQLDSLSISANQFYGPTGNGALYIRKGVRVQPYLEGGIQEGGRRAGTENIAGIVGMGVAAELAGQEMKTRRIHAAGLRDKIIKGLSGAVDHVYLTGHPTERLPHHASFCIEFIEGEAMLLSLDMKGIAAASGSACTSKALKASHVLLAMGFDHALAQGSLVFSVIQETMEEDIGHLLDVFPPIIDRLRQMSPLYNQYLEENK